MAGMKTVLGILVLAALAGCSTEQGYASARQWQRNECLRLQDRDEQARCMKSNAQSYSDYQAERARSKP